MAINNTDIEHSLDHIFNSSFDKKYQMLGVELVGFDPLSSVDGALKRVTVNALGEYVVNDILESGTVTYIGKEDPAGDWYIQKIDTSSGTSIRFATIRNNTLTTSYSDAWTDKLTLNYDTYSVAF